MSSPTILAIVGGLGLSPVVEENAVRQARMPWFMHAMETYPALSLSASGLAVGLLEQAGGTPEAGYRTIGLGRAWHPSETRVDAAIAQKGIAANATIRKIASHLAKTGGRLHLIGLVSSDETYAHQSHLHALLDFAAEKHIACSVHAIVDSDSRSERLLQSMSDRLVAEHIGILSSVSGMAYAMDDNGYWDKTAQAYAAMAHGRARACESIEEGFASAREHDADGVFLEPFILRGAEPAHAIREQDAVLFWNIRPYGMRQLLLAFALPSFHAFERGTRIRAMLATMVPYDRDVPADAAYPSERTDISLGSVLSDAGLRQFRIAETERYAHATVFLNGMAEQPFAGEHRLILPSPSVSSYDLAPDMRMHDIAERVVQEVAVAGQDIIICSLAGPDIIARTGNMQAAIAACEAADHALARIAEAVLAVGGTMFVTADHARAESVMDPITGRARLEGTNNPVPFIIVRQAFEGFKAPSGDVLSGAAAFMNPTGTLADVAPTIIKSLGLHVPKEMTGRSLLPSV
ncbi:MAG: 2,3-bisphosphoglycerate-independent phosphoglycerate mutase [Patescibacteria group bacterium]